LESTISARALRRTWSAHCGNGQHPRRFTLVKADIQAPELIDIVAGANPHVIFHLAAQVDVFASVSDPQFDARSNVLGTINLCEAARLAGVRRIVYAASAASRYGTHARLPVDETN
jgi:UDP-glucose 4-epimerase